MTPRRQPSRHRINPGHGPMRGAARAFGVVLVVAGAIFAIVGFADFFGSFGSRDHRMPTKFWCVFVGFPLLGIGGALLRYGFMGAVARYSAQEIAPVATDTVNYIADETRDSVGGLAEAVGRGLTAGRGGAAGTREVIRCHKCNRENPSDAGFCNGCGAPLAKTKPCAACGELNDPDARFCDDCGRAFE